MASSKVDETLDPDFLFQVLHEDQFASQLNHAHFKWAGKKCSYFARICLNLLVKTPNSW